MFENHAFFTITSKLHIFRGTVESNLPENKYTVKDYTELIQTVPRQDIITDEDDASSEIVVNKKKTSEQIKKVILINKTGYSVEQHMRKHRSVKETKNLIFDFLSFSFFFFSFMFNLKFWL